MPSLNLDIDGFAWSRLTELSDSAGLRVEEVVRHAVAYYLADLDRGRIAARPANLEASAPIEMSAADKASRT